MNAHCPEEWAPPAPADVRSKLAESGATQAAAAAALGVCPRQVRRWVSGATRIGWAQWYTLCAWAGEVVAQGYRA